MHHYQVGRGPDGRSAVVHERAINIEPNPGDTSGAVIDRFGAWSAEMLDRPLDREVKDSEFHLIKVDPGAMNWTMFRMLPGYVSKMHHTDTLDFNIVLAGDTQILLGAGEVHLHPGDSILMGGVEHQWRAGAQGCTVACFVRGMRRAA